MANGGTNSLPRTIAAASGVVGGDPVLVSAGGNLSGMALTGSADSATSLYWRFNNESGAAVDMPSTKYRARKISTHETKARGSATYDQASLADGAGSTTTVTVPCAFGDFVYWGASFAPATTTYSALMVSTYVSATNTVAIRLQNESGGIVDPASATLYAYVINESAFDYLGATVNDPPSLIDGASHEILVTVPGASINDFAVASFSVTLQGISHSVEIYAASSARVMLYNETGGTIDLASMVVKVGAFAGVG